MITKFKLFELVDVDNSYDYRFVRPEEFPIDYKQRNNVYTFGFISQDDIYMIDIYRYWWGVSFEWCNKKDYFDPNRKNFIDEKTTIDYNLNVLHRILNTIFKILFDFMDEHKIDVGVIGSCNKNKARMYKQIINEDPYCEYVEPVKQIHGTKVWYGLEFRRKILKRKYNIKNKYLK